MPEDKFEYEMKYKRRIAPEVLLKHMEDIEKSKKKDCAEYGNDCVYDPMFNGCPKGCGSYNMETSETEDDLIVCGCKAPREKLEIAHVTYAHWNVLCHACGALSSGSKHKSGAVQKWNDNKLARPIGYFNTKEHINGLIESGKFIAGL